MLVADANRHDTHTQTELAVSLQLALFSTFSGPSAVSKSYYTSFLESPPPPSTKHVCFQVKKSCSSADEAESENTRVRGQNEREILNY